jgi:hypothetical protein
MNVPDRKSRVKSVLSRSVKEFEEIQKITGAKNLPKFELLMQNKARIVQQTKAVLEESWNNRLDAIYRGDIADSRMFPIKEFHDRLNDVERCCTEYTRYGPVFACQQSLACPICNSHAAYAFASQRTAMLFEQLGKVDYVKVFEIVINFGDVYMSFAPERFDELSQVRTDIRDFFAKRDKAFLLQGSKRGYPKTYRLLDMFIHSAPSTVNTQMIFPHLHVVGVPVSTRTTLDDFVDAVYAACKNWNIQAGVNFSPSETFYAKKASGKKTKNTKDFFRKMHYLARCIKPSSHNGNSYLSTVTSVPRILRQRTSKSGTTVSEQYRKIKAAGNAKIIARFDSQVSQFRIV